MSIIPRIKIKIMYLEGLKSAASSFYRQGTRSLKSQYDSLGVLNPDLLSQVVKWMQYLLLSTPSPAHTSFGDPLLLSIRLCHSYPIQSLWFRWYGPQSPPATPREGDTGRPGEATHSSRTSLQLWEKRHPLPLGPCEWEPWNHGASSSQLVTM